MGIQPEKMFPVHIPSMCIHGVLELSRCWFTLAPPKMDNVTVGYDDDLRGGVQ